LKDLGEISSFSRFRGFRFVDSTQWPWLIEFFAYLPETFFFTSPKLFSYLPELHPKLFLTSPKLFLWFAFCSQDFSEDVWFNGLLKNGGKKRLAVDSYNEYTHDG